jgi:hypothetical protein
MHRHQHLPRNERKSVTTAIFVDLPGDRAIARLVAVLVLSLALAAPAWSADGSDEQPVQATGSQGNSQAEGGDTSGSDSSTEDDGEVSGSGSGSGSEDCNPNYEGECLDQPGDYDCPSREGDGPNFTQGEVEVVGEDEYDLDNEDDDNIGCNDQDGEGSSDDGATPSGGVDSGFGGTATQFTGETTSEPASLPLLAGGVLVALAASGIVVLAARKRA